MLLSWCLIQLFFINGGHYTGMLNYNCRNVLLLSLSYKCKSLINVMNVITGGCINDCPSYAVLTYARYFHVNVRWNVGGETVRVEETGVYCITKKVLNFHWNPHQHLSFFYLMHYSGQGDRGWGWRGVSVCRNMGEGNIVGEERRCMVYGWRRDKRLRTFFRVCSGCVCVCVNIYVKQERLGQKGKR